MLRGSWLGLRSLEKVWSQLLAGNAGRLLDLNNKLSRNLVPLRYRASGYLQGFGNSGRGTPGGPDQINSDWLYHGNPLSMTEHDSARTLLSANKRLWLHYADMKPGDIIKAARNKAGLSQRALAALLKITPSAVAQWEIHDTVPTQDNWTALRSILSIPDKIEPSGSAPYGGEVVDDPDELALLQFWRSLDDDKKRAVIDLLHIGRR